MSIRRRDEAIPPLVAITAEQVTAEVPVSGGAGVACLLRMEYRSNDPLVVTLVLQAPSRAPVLDRTVLRSDLRATPRQSMGQTDLVAGPSSQAGLIQVVFVEQGTSLGLVVPVDLVEDFLAATGTIVPMDDAAEARAVDRLLATLPER